MQQHEEVFLRVLRSALWGHPVQIPDGFNDWGAVMKLANMQAVNGLVWDVMVTNQKIKASIPEQALAAMRDIPKNNLSMHTKLNNALILVVTTLRESARFSSSPISILWNSARAASASSVLPSSFSAVMALLILT